MFADAKLQPVLRRLFNYRSASLSLIFAFKRSYSVVRVGRTADGSPVFMYKTVHRVALCTNLVAQKRARFWGNKGYHGDLSHPLFWPVKWKGAIWSPLKENAIQLIHKPVTR